MDFAEMYAWWNGAAQCNAMNAILSNVVDWDLEEFFATGRQWLDGHRDFANSVGAGVSGATALDFGCGIGRMTAALADFYAHVVGIDISDEMITKAREHQPVDTIEFQQVPSLPLPFADDTFDMVYSTIVVQHIPLPYNLGYVDEFFRVSRSVVLFDAPSHKLRATDPEPDGGIFLLPRDLVLNRAAVHGFELLGLRSFPATPTRHYQYVFARTGA